MKSIISYISLYQYEIAAALQVSEYTLCKWLRRPLSEEREKAIEAAIQSLVSGGDLND